MAGIDMEKFAGIPGTIAPEAGRLRWIRRSDDPGTGARTYSADVADGRLWAMVSQDAAGKGSKPLWHISVSHRTPDLKPGRLPSWDELKSAAYRLVQADVPFILIFPRRSTPDSGYVNLAENCLHLWESDQEIDQ